jgi:hypothetical protein
MVKRIGFIVITFSLWSFSYVLGNNYVSHTGKYPNYEYTFNDSLTVDDYFDVEYLPLFNRVFIEIEDLQDCNIEIKDKKIKTTMASRPKFLSLFRVRDKRKYVIVYNSNPDFDGVHLKDVPENALAGLYAHELMHIRDYQSKGFFGVIKRGWQYLSKRGKKKLEHQIDIMTIETGFGKSLYEWAFYVLNNSSASKDYKAFKREIYMSPEDILSRLKR